MSVDKRVKYDVQGGVKNYLGKQKEIKAPLKWQSSPDHPTTELAYITQAEKDLLVKQDLHGSLNGGVNRGPSGIMSLNGWGSTDSSQNVSGTAASAAETGSRNERDRAQVRAEMSGPGPALPPGVTPQAAQDFRSAAINAGAGQRVNPGFFESKYNPTVSAKDIAFAKAYRNDPNHIFAKGAYKNTRGRNFGGLGSLIMGGLGMLMGIPGLGLITGGFNKLKDGLGGLGKTLFGRGTNPDGSPRTQKQWQQAMDARRQQNRVYKLLKAKDRGYNQIGFGKYTAKTKDFTENQQALLNDLIAKGYGPTSLDNPNPTFQNDLDNPYMDLNDVESIVAASQVPQGIDFTNANAIRAMTQPTTYTNTPFEGARTVDTYRGVDPYKMNYLNRDLPTSYRSESLLDEQPQQQGIMSYPSDLADEFQDMAIQARVSPQDLARYSQQGDLTRATDYGTAMDTIYSGSQMTPYEYAQLQQGNITKPGVYPDGSIGI